MNGKIKYTDEPIGNPKVIPDFLPAPEDLVFRAWLTGAHGTRCAAGSFRYAVVTGARVRNYTTLSRYHSIALGAHAALEIRQVS